MYVICLSFKKFKNGQIYKGLTDNIDRRLEEHQNGKGPSIKASLPFELIHIEICEDRKSARVLEKYFKSGYGPEIAKELAE